MPKPIEQILKEQIGHLIFSLAQQESQISVLVEEKDVLAKELASVKKLMTESGLNVREPDKKPESPESAKVHELLKPPLKEVKS